MGNLCTKEDPVQPGTNEPTNNPPEAGIRPAAPAVPDQTHPPGPMPPARGVSDITTPFGDPNASPLTSGFGGYAGASDWVAHDQVPVLNAKVAEARQRAKPRSWTAFADLKEFGSYMTKRLLNRANNEFYEGHHQRDIPYGWGTLIGRDGDLLEGVFFDGKPVRYIRHIDTNGTVYEGDYLLGRNGKGSVTYLNGEVIRCEKWANGVPQDIITKEDQFGKLLFRGIIGPKGYEGKCLVANNGFNIEATYKEGVIQGPISKIYPDGSRYDGAVDANFLEEGQGTLTFSDGRKFEGPFIKGKANGKGFFTTDSGKRVEQTWKDGKRV